MSIEYDAPATRVRVHQGHSHDRTTTTVFVRLRELTDEDYGHALNIVGAEGEVDVVNGEVVTMTVRFETPGGNRD